LEAARDDVPGLHRVPEGDLAPDLVEQPSV
jgi:hypothetical protein